MIIAELARGYSVIAGSVSSPRKAALVRASAVTCATRVARVGRGLTARRLTSHDSKTKSLIE